MPIPTRSPSENVQRRQHNRGDEPPRARGPEPRDFESEVSDSGRNYDAPIDTNGEPVERGVEDINTHGSER